MRVLSSNWQNGLFRHQGDVIIGWTISKLLGEKFGVLNTSFAIFLFIYFILV